MALRRLTAAMNGRGFDPASSDHAKESLPYSQEFTRALLKFSHGNAGEAETLTALNLEDAGVLPIFVQQLSAAGRKISMDGAALARLNTSL